MRIDDKKEELGKFLEELEKIMPQDIKEYKENFEKRAACERYLEKIIEACVDIGYLIIKKRKLKIPKDDGGVFLILGEEKIISENLAEKLRDARGMRNILAHEYGNVDDEIIFSALTEEIIRDINDFLKEINKNE